MFSQKKIWWSAARPSVQKKPLRTKTKQVERGGLKVTVSQTKGTTDYTLAERISVARVQPTTSKGITDMLLPQTSLH